jgi:diguanylate cyclase (GGDEF)-like protein
MPEHGGSPAARLKLAAAAAALVALSIPLWATMPGPDVPSGPVVFPWWALACAFVLTELFVIDIHVRSDAHSVSLGEIPFMLGLALASPAGLLLGRVVGAGFVLAAHRRQAWHKMVFNLGIFTLDSAVALTVYRLLLAGRSQVSLAGLGAGVVALLAALVVGVVAVGIAIVLTRPEANPLAVARSLMAGTVIGVVNSSLAIGGLVLAWQDPLALVGVAAAAAGFYGLLRVYGAMSKRYGDLEALYAFTSGMDAAPAADDLLEVTLEQMRGFFGAAVVEAVLVRGVGSAVVRLDDGGVRRRPAPPALISGLTGILPEGEAVIAVGLDDAPEGLADHYREDGLADSMVAILGGGAGTATLLVVGPRRDGLGYSRDDLRLLDALGRHARVSFERGRLVDRLRREIAQKDHQAVHDALTGLPNRLHFGIVVQEALRRARNDDSRVAVLLIDLDRFKEVNDTLGHQRGDVLLQEMALRLSETVGEEHVARLGGDEFGVLLRGLDGIAEAVEWARKLVGVMSRPFINEGLAIQVSGSIGIAMAPDHGSEGSILLRRADVAMYEAKAHGAAFEVYDERTDKYSTRRLAMAAELRSAIEMDEISLSYQPKADIGTGAVVGMEALARWRHDRHGNVPPDEFVDLAERTGLIKALTEHVLHTALRDLKRLHRAGFQIGVAVNIAASSLVDAEFPEFVERLLAEHDMSPHFLTLEVTETTMMTDSARARMVLAGLDELGVELSIDDYGTGYSSLAYLSDLPIREVKVDRSFVTDMAVDERLAKIVSSTTSLVHSLGKKVVAEGVESRVTWDLLAAAGCDIAQGYYLSRPIPLGDMLAWLEAGGIPVGEVADHGAPVID